MKNYLNQTTVNVVAITTAVVTVLSLVGGNGHTPSKAMRDQMLANRQLDYAIGRIKACGELQRYGVYIDPKSPDASLCADVVVTFPEQN
tara:strand:- start:598 stop:864 length:267 start_codon:yes stop_codon:yes gene_type:complete